MTLLSILTIALTLYVSGLFGLFYLNITRALEKVGERVQMVVFLEDDAPASEVEKLREELDEHEGVTGAAYTSKDSALIRFRKELGDNAYLLDDMDGNPLPASIEVSFEEPYRNTGSLRSLAEELEKFDFIEVVDYAKPWTEKLDRARRLIGLAGLGTSLIVAAAAVLLISFSVGLALKSREDEMSVVRLVGASGFYISWPYLLEGFLKGLMGGLGALLLLFATRRMLITGLYPVFFFTPYQAAAGVLTGGLIGAVGAALSVKRFLKVLLVFAFMVQFQAMGAQALYSQSKDKQEIGTEIKNGQSELDRIREELRKNEAEANRLRSKEKSVSGEIQNLDRGIDLKDQLVKEIGREIKKEEHELETIISRMKNTNLELTSRRKVLAKRLKLVYQHGVLNPLEIMFDTGSLPRLGLRLEYLSRVLDHDRGLVEEISILKEKIETSEREKEAKLVSVTNRKKEVDREKIALQASSKRKKVLLTSVKKEKSQKEKTVAELKAQEDRLQKLIQRLEEERLLAERSGTKVGGPIEKSRGRLPWPVNGKVIKKFGSIYDPETKTKISSQGVDISALQGVGVKSVEAGKIEYADWWQTYGKMVIVNHGGGYYSLYAHLDDIRVSTGIEVARGQQIGTVGNTGSLRDPNLHFELRKGKVALDPLKWLMRR